MKNKMKKAGNVLFVCFILMAACILKSQDAHAEKVGKYDLSDTGLNTKYDVTGDGKPDTVEFKKMNYDGETYTGFEVFINGKTVLKEDKTCYYLEIKSVFIQTKKHGYFLIRLAEFNGAGSEMMYEYINGKLIKRIDLDKVLGKIFIAYEASVVYSTTVSSVKSDAIKLKVTGLTYMLSGTNTSLTYKVGTKGKLSLAKEIVDVSYDDLRYRMKDGKTYKSKYLIATTNIPVYHKATGTKKAFTIKKGTKLKITKFSVKGKGRYYCITKSGKKGWIKNRNRDGGGCFQDLRMYN